MKWCAIQPLTGGMYLGTEKVIGNKAEFILSFPGLNDVKYDKEGNKSSCGNEYSLLEYLKKCGRDVPYHIFNRNMFDAVEDDVSDISFEDGFNIYEHNDIDICVAVPVCSGLSSATIASQEEKDRKNCNMMFITKYALSVIKPKVYIFENAPRMMSLVGERIRKKLESLAKENNYSVIYYKTDSIYHHNCQKRPRTFIYFLRNDIINSEVPDIKYERDEYDSVSYLNMITEDATQQEEIKSYYFVHACIEYMKKNFVEWRNVTNNPWAYIVNNNLYDSFIKFSEGYQTDIVKHKQLVRYCKHCQDCVNMGKGYYNIGPKVPVNGLMNAVMHRNCYTMMHPVEDRLLTVREYLWLMGMPFDFELQGNIQKEFVKIGQNVPVNTAAFIVEQAIRIINHININDHKDCFVRFFDNTKMKEIELL